MATLQTFPLCSKAVKQKTKRRYFLGSLQSLCQDLTRRYLHQFDLPTSDDLFHYFDFLQGEPAQYMFESPRLNFL